jgi:acyl-CoA reductase-like NAD-dependent aldehyde dehydrogenase
MHQRADEFALRDARDGQAISEARGEVEFSAQILRYYAKHAERFLAPGCAGIARDRRSWRTLCKQWC